MLPSDGPALRDRVVAELSQRLPEDEVRAWFDPGKITLLPSGSSCELQVKNVFLAEHYEKNYRRALEEVLSRVAEVPVRLAIRVNGEAGGAKPAAEPAGRAEPKVAAAISAAGGGPRE